MPKQVFPFRLKGFVVYWLMDGCFFTIWWQKTKLIYCKKFRAYDTTYIPKQSAKYGYFEELPLSQYFQQRNADSGFTQSLLSKSLNSVCIVSGNSSMPIMTSFLKNIYSKQHNLFNPNGPTSYLLMANLFPLPVLSQSISWDYRELETTLLDFTYLL